MVSSSLSVLISSLFLSFFPLDHDNTDFARQSLEESRVVYKCEKATWETPLFFQGNVLKGKLKGVCTFQAENGGGYAKLKSFFQDIIEKQSEKIVEGPTETQTDGNVTKTFYDSILLFEGKNDQGQVDTRVVPRQATTISTDFTTFGSLYSETKSVDLKRALGVGKHFRHATVNAVVGVTDKEKQYKLTLEADFGIDKGGYPAGLFKSQVQKQIEKLIPDTQKKLLAEIAQNIR